VCVHVAVVVVVVAPHLSPELRPSVPRRKPAHARLLAAASAQGDEASASQAAPTGSVALTYTSYEGNSFRLQFSKSGAQLSSAPPCARPLRDGGWSAASQPASQPVDAPAALGAVGVSVLVDPWLVDKLEFGGQAWAFSGSKRVVRPEALDLDRLAAETDFILLTQARGAGCAALGCPALGGELRRACCGGRAGYGKATAHMPAPHCVQGKQGWPAAQALACALRHLQSRLTWHGIAPQPTRSTAPLPLALLDECRASTTTRTGRRCSAFQSLCLSSPRPLLPRQAAVLPPPSSLLSPPPTPWDGRSLRRAAARNPAIPGLLLAVRVSWGASSSQGCVLGWASRGQGGLPGMRVGAGSQ
jgi:hypothetical protein